MTTTTGAGTARLVVAIPHHWSTRLPAAGPRTGTADERARMLRRSITTLHETFAGTRRVSPGYDVPFGPSCHVEVVVVTGPGGEHLLEHLEPVRPLFSHVERTVDDPLWLAFECRSVLAERAADFDELGCIEDDIVVADPLFFEKLRWFRDHSPPDAVLMPNRFERRDGLKAYIDPVLSPAETASFQDLARPAELVHPWQGIGPLTFRQVDNPHAGCWFVSAEQMRRWVRHPRFSDRSAEFVAARESGMCPAVGGPFRIYKPVLPRPDFLEVEHQTVAYLEQWGLREELPPAAMRRVHDLSRQVVEVERRAADAEAAYEALRNSPTFRLTAPLRKALRLVLPRRTP